MSDDIHNLFIDTVIKAKDAPVRDGGRVTLSKVIEMTNDLYREAVRKSVVEGHMVLQRHFEKIIATMPAPPDPFWNEVSL